MARTWKTAKQLLTITKQFFESPGMSNNVGNAGCMIQKGQQSVSSAKLSSAASVSNKKEHVPQCPFHQAKSQRQIATHTENVGIKPATELPGAPAFPFIGTMYTFFTRRVRERLQEISVSCDFLLFVIYLLMQKNPLPFPPKIISSYIYIYCFFQKYAIICHLLKTVSRKYDHVIFLL